MVTAVNAQAVEINIVGSRLDDVRVGIQDEVSISRKIINDSQVNGGLPPANILLIQLAYSEFRSRIILEF